MGNPTFFFNVPLNGLEARSVEQRNLAMADIPYQGEVAAWCLYNRVSSGLAVMVNRLDLLAYGASTVIPGSAPSLSSFSAGIVTSYSLLEAATVSSLDTVSPSLPVGVVLGTATQVDITDSGMNRLLGRLSTVPTAITPMLSNARGFGGGPLDLSNSARWEGAVQPITLRPGEAYGWVMDSTNPSNMLTPVVLEVLLSVDGKAYRALLPLTSVLQAGSGFVLHNNTASNLLKLHSLSLIEQATDISSIYSLDLIDSIESDGPPVPVVPMSSDRPLPSGIRVQRDAQVSIGGEKRGALLTAHYRRMMPTGVGTPSLFRTECWQNTTGGMRPMMTVRPGQGLAIVQRANGHDNFFELTGMFTISPVSGTSRSEVPVYVS